MFDCSTRCHLCSSALSSIRRDRLTLDIRFKFPNVCPRDLGVDDISLGGNLSVWRGRKSNIPINRWFINYLKTFILARVLNPTIGRTVVKKHLTEFLCFLISWSLGSIDIVDVVFHISIISRTQLSHSVDILNQSRIRTVHLSF
jgi:hypothetical protein